MAGAMMHVAFVLSVRGIPQLYAGEEIAMEGKEDPDNRRDFPSDAFKAEGRKPREREMFEWTRSWIKLRRDHAAMRSGKLIDLFVDDETYVFARQLGEEKIVVAFNRESKQKQVVIPEEMTLRPLIGEASTRVEKGETTLTLPPHTAVALKVL
jgi:glycosidase